MTLLVGNGGAQLPCTRHPSTEWLLLGFQLRALRFNYGNRA